MLTQPVLLCKVHLTALLLLLLCFSPQKTWESTAQLNLCCKGIGINVLHRALVWFPPWGSHSAFAVFYKALRDRVSLQSLARINVVLVLPPRAGAKVGEKTTRHCYINRCSSQLQCLHLLLPEEGSAGLQQQRPHERSLNEHCRSEGGKQSAKHVEGCSLCQNVSFRGPHCHAKPPGQFLGASFLLLAIAPWLSSFSTGSITRTGTGVLLWIQQVTWTFFSELPCALALDPCRLADVGLVGFCCLKRNCKEGLRCVDLSRLLAPQPTRDVVF